MTELAESAPLDRHSDSDGDENNETQDQPEMEENQTEVVGPTGAPAAKKKRRKKKKKTNGENGISAENAAAAEEDAKPVLKISRAKHWKYISSYHGQWLQLPHEILDTLLVINCGPHDDAIEMAQSAADLSDRLSLLGPASARRAKLEAADQNHSQHYPHSGGGGREEDKLPPPIDAAVFRGVNQVRRLVEEASDLATRAASGLLSAALGAFSNTPQTNGSPYDDLFGSPYGNGAGSGRRGDSGRSQMMSPTRQLRLRSLAVSKLASAYRIDEVAASVAVMQGSTALDDLAEKVLKQEPGDVDARYVHFFHEKIRSRTLAQSSATDTLDLLIAQNPNRLEFYRTKSVIHAARHEFAEAIQTLTQALLIARTLRKAKVKHTTNGDAGSRTNGRSRGKGKRGKQHRTDSPSEENPTNGNIAEENGSTPAIEEAAAIGHEAGDDLERQLYFHRAMAYFHWAFSLLEDTALRVEKVKKPAGGLSNEGGEATLEAIGIKGLNACGLLGKSRSDLNGARDRYFGAFSDDNLQTEVRTLLSRAVRDHERFLSYFPLYQPPRGSALSTDKRTTPPPPKKKRDDKISDFHIKRMMQHRSLEGRTRYTHPEDGDPDSEPTLLTTYHPLLVESHFTILIANLMLGDFPAALRKHYQLASIMATLEGFPVFLPARSVSQAQYSEILERLGVTWLPEYQKTGAKSPTGTEEEIAERGGLAPLHHIVDFFSPEYNLLLADAAENSTKHQKQAQGGRLAITNGDAAADRKPASPVLYSARSEIACAWLHAYIIPNLNAQVEETPEPEQEPTHLGSSSSNKKGKGRA